MPAKICFCYAHEDEPLLKKLKVYLRPLQRQGLIDVWYDRDIQAGAEWEQEIRGHLNTANIILLLISPDFMNSDYCYGTEMKQALERHERGEVRVIPIVLRPTDWHNIPLSNLQALPMNGTPLTSRKWRNRDEAIFTVAEDIKKVIKNFVPTSNGLSYGEQKEISQSAASDFKNVPTRLLEILPHKRLCPACIEEFYPGDCRVLSAITREELSPAPKGWLEKHYARMHPESLHQPKFMLKDARRECPNCGYLLPSNIESVENISIVVVGDVASGKSHYIAALINELQVGEAFARNNIQAITLTPDIAKRYQDEYTAPLFQHLQVLPSTPSRPKSVAYYEPLIYELRFSNPLERTVRSVNLILYDGAGEDYMDPQKLVERARYVLYANAIIFLADPLNMHEIVTRLFPTLQTPLRARSTHQALAFIMRLLETYHGSNANYLSRHTPVAVTISKSDLIKELDGLPQQYQFLSEPEYKRTIDWQDIRIVDKEVRDFVQKFGDIGLLQETLAIPEVKFFAVSSTGHAPNAHGVFPAVEPLRCLDPIFWILHTLDFIR